MMSLPILSSRFFKKHRPDGGFFSKWSTFYAWNDKILPIYEWEGVLFIGCSLPPTEFPRMGSKKVVFVLCEPGILQELWLDFQAPAQKANPVQPQEEAGATAISSQFSGLPVPPEEKQSQNFSEIPVLPEEPSLQEPQAPLANFPSLPEEDSEPVFATDFSNLADLPEPPVESGNISETFFSEPQKTAIFNPKDLEKEKSVDPIEIDEKTDPGIQLAESPVSADSSEMPEGLSLSVAQPPSKSAGEVEELTLLDTEEAAEKPASNSEDGGLELLDLSVGNDSSTKEPTQSITLKLKETTDPLQSTETLTASEESVVDMMKDLSSNLEKTQSKIAGAPEKRAVPVRSEVLSGGEVTRWSHNVLNTTPTNKLDNWMSKLFEELHGKFKKSMVLLKSGDNAKPWKWDPLFKQDPSTRAEISLVHPSPFRIVARTKKPYHGYVVPNEINKRFFTEWNGAQIPEHLTIAPILVNEHVIGVLLAIGEKSSDTKEALKLAESIAGEIAMQIKEQPDSFKAA